MSALRSTLSSIGRMGLVALAVYSLLPSQVSEILVENGVQAKAAKTRSSTGFVVTARGWTEFAIPQEQSLVKVVSNGNVSEGIYSIQDLQCEYVLRLEVLDGDRVVLKTEEAVLRAAPLSYRDDVTGAVLPVQTYLGISLLPLGSRTTIINLVGLETTARRLRISVVQSDPRVRDVTLRVYANQKPAAYKLRYLWQRMPLEKRERLARASVHAIDFLSDQEKRNLLENRWVAVAPVGIDGKEFFERKIFSLKERHDSLSTGSILPYGLFVGPGTLGTLPIPEGGGCIRLEIQRPPGTPPAPVVRLLWWRRNGLDPVETDLDLHAETLSYSLDLDGGILVIESSDPIVVRGYVDGGVNTTEITPEAKCAQFFRVRGGSPIEFSTVSGSEGPGVIRLDVRRVPLEGKLDVEQEISLAHDFLDEQGKVLGSGRLTHSEPDSWYDRVTGTSRVVPVSDASRHYFSFPASCTSFRIYSSTDIACVTAYTRPNDLVRKLRIPEDYLLFERRQEDSRTWFPLRPRRFTEYLANDSEVLVRTQPRPPELTAGPEAESSHTEVRTPDGDVNALKLLTPVDPVGAQPWQASPAYFVKLDSRVPRDLYLGDGKGAPFVRPRLISLLETGGEALVSVLLDGRLHFQSAQASRSKEELLPPVSEGWHKIHAEAPSGTGLYLNSILVEAEELFLERTAHRIGRDGLKYRVLKETSRRETLALRLYMPSVLRAEAVVSLLLRGVKKTECLSTDSWTYLETVYEIRAPDAGNIQAIAANEGPFTGGSLFLSYLGTDLAPGWYEIFVRLLEGPPSCLSVLHIIPGKKEVRGVSSEASFITGDSEP